MQIREYYRSFKRMFRPQDIVLMYHRVATPARDPWQLSVSPENFEQQLQVLQKSHQVVPLKQLLGSIRNRPLGKGKIAITFDDGYLDNYLFAKPLLEKYRLPATFFVTSQNIDTKKEFWWDELEKIIFETPELPRELILNLNGKPFSFDLGEEKQLTEELREKHKNLIAFEPLSKRSHLYLRLWEHLSPMTAPGQQKCLEQLRNWAGAKSEEARADYLCMSSEQLAALAKNSLFSVGGHTATHPALAYHQKEVQREEVRNNKIFLEKVTGQRVNFFAYPSGNFNDTTVEVLKEEGFEGGFTTNSGPISRNDNPYLLNRLQVNNWNKNEFAWVIAKCIEG